MSRGGWIAEEAKGRSRPVSRVSSPASEGDRQERSSALNHGEPTLVGIPAVWVHLVVPELVGGGWALGIDSFWRRVWAVTVQAAWLIPYESELH